MKHMQGDAEQALEGQCSSTHIWGDLADSHLLLQEEWEGTQIVKSEAGPDHEMNISNTDLSKQI